MRTVAFVCILCHCLGLVSLSQAIKCYQCAYIQGIRDDGFNPDCVDNIGSGSIPLEEAAACLHVKGEHGHQIYNRADKIFLPDGTSSTNCHAVNISVKRVGRRIINSIDLCQVCTHQDGCNQSSLFKMSSFVLVMMLFLFLGYLNYAV